jgi:DNA-binding transcriptional LysR family regulator
MERAGVTPTIAAEVHHNVHLHLALIQSGYGVGLLPARFIARKEFKGTVAVLRPPSFHLPLSVAIVRAGHLGALERAVELLEHGIRHLFEAASTTNSVTRSRRRVPANRRKSRSRK